MNLQATAKSIRISPRKMRLVIDQVRGLPVLRAENVLRFMNKQAARPVLKLLQSAMASAEHNYKLDKRNLTVASVFANEGVTMKRSRARAFGRGVVVRKRTCHVIMTLAEITPGKKVLAAKPADKKVAAAPAGATAVAKKPTDRT